MSICPDKFDVIERDGINLEEAIQGIFSSSFENAFPGVSIAKVLIAPHREYDYQVNNALALAKSLKRDVHDIMQAIVDHLPKNALLDRVDIDPKGFLMIKINDSYLKNAVEHIATKGSYEIGVQRRETSNRRTVLVDFSSPNIAKDMHVGHLRSTIIGDCLCRIYEFTGHQVLRTNHVGDWGTQFGMLIAYLKQEYPHFLKVPPPIADLAAFYKKAKKEFDEVADFKAVAYSEVVALQQGNPEAVRAWTVLCDISRLEFQSMYDLLNVKLKEVGESFYRDWIPTALQKAEDAGMIQTLADGAKVIMPKEEFELSKTDAKALRRLFLSTFREFSKEVQLHQLMGEELGIKESIVERGEIPLGSNKVTRIDQLDWQTEGEKVYKLCEKKLLPNGAKLHPTLKQLFRERGFLRVRSSKDTKEDDASAGIEVISIPRYEYPLIVVKRDGGYTYDTTDLAAVFYRSQILQAQHIVYVTDKGQAGHFQLIFAAAEDMGWVHPKLKSTTARSGTSVEHVDFGLVTGEDGKRLRTRSGDTVRLRDLIDEAISRCYEISKQREAEHPQGHTEEVLRDNARVLGVAAIKYYDLRQHRSTDYAFSYDKMCDLSGNTALYLLYAYVRVCGVLRKAAKMDKEKETSLPESESCPVTIDLSAHATQRALALHICRFGGTLDRVLEESMPSRLTDYTYQLVCKFSDLYAACPILGNESTMHLCRVTGYMIRTCLQLLGIDVVEKL